MKSQLKIILASTSPQRINLLNLAGFQFECVEPNYQEIDDPSLAPRQQAILHAKNKANSVSAHHPNRIIIACDTVVDLNGKLIGKPQNKKHAAKIIAELQSKQLKVISGLSVINTSANISKTIAVTSYLDCLPMTKAEINLYLDSHEWENKSGAFSIQGLGSRFIQLKKGDYYNVVGLPIAKLAQILKSIQ